MKLLVFCVIFIIFVNVNRSGQALRAERVIK